MYGVQWVIFSFGSRLSNILLPPPLSAETEEANLFLIKYKELSYVSDKENTLFLYSFCTISIAESFYSFEIGGAESVSNFSCH